MNKWHKFKPLPDDIKIRLSRLTNIFITEDVLLAYLFGSLVNGSHANDVDLAILMPREKRPYSLLAPIVLTLETERIDIVDLRRASPQFAFQIIKTGQSIYSIDEKTQLDFERHVLRQYKDTAWLRQKQELLLRERIKQWSSSETALSSD